MNVREFKQEDYEFAKHWWSRRGYYITPSFMIPPTGFTVVDDENFPVAIGFLICTDAGVAGPGHLVADPLVNRFTRGEALDKLISAIVEKAKSLGFKALGAQTNIKSLTERYKKHGFVLTDENVNCLLMET